MKILLIMYNRGIEKIQLYYGEVKNGNYIKLLDINDEVFDSVYALQNHKKHKIMWFVEEICQYLDTPSHNYHLKIEQNLGLKLVESLTMLPNTKIIRFVL